MCHAGHAKPGMALHEGTEANLQHILECLYLADLEPPVPRSLETVAREIHQAGKPH